MNTAMTKDDVFEALLEEYETADTTVIWEYSGNIEGDIEELSQEIKEWRARYYTAKPTIKYDTDEFSEREIERMKQGKVISHRPKK